VGNERIAGIALGWHRDSLASRFAGSLDVRSRWKQTSCAAKPTVSEGILQRQVWAEVVPLCGSTACFTQKVFETGKVY
jgi:hypothetical protein